MQATVTFNETENRPVLTLTTQTVQEDKDLSLMAAFDNFRIVIELDDSDELIFAQAETH